jgi:RNA polymerase sigma-70 factor, ECF subfamily
MAAGAARRPQGARSRVRFNIEAVYNSCTARGENLASYSSLSVGELVRRCAGSADIYAWEEFVRRFHRPIAMVVWRTANRLGDSSPHTVDDLIQDTYVKLCADSFRILRDVEERHPGGFIAFAKVVAANVVRDHFKYLHSLRRGASWLQESPEDFDPAAGEDSIGSPKSIERAVLIREIERHLECSLNTLDRDRDFRIFWLYYRSGLSAAAIAALPGTNLTTKGVESLILRMTRELRARIMAPPHRDLDEIREQSKGVFPAQSL